MYRRRSRTSSFAVPFSPSLLQTDSVKGLMLSRNRGLGQGHADCMPAGVQAANAPSVPRRIFCDPSASQATRTGALNLLVFA